MTRPQHRACGLGFAAGFLLLLLTSACGPVPHDLEVVNNWDRGVVLYVVSERAGLPNQQVPLGTIAGGATQRFAVQIPRSADRLRLRYAYNSGSGFEEHADACIAGDQFRQLAAWRLVIPTGKPCS